MSDAKMIHDSRILAAVDNDVLIECGRIYITGEGWLGREGQETYLPRLVPGRWL